MQKIIFLVLFHILLLHNLHYSESSSKCSKSSECSRLNFKNCLKKPNCDKDEEKYIICYFTDWAWYRSAPANFLPENIDPSLCTHVFFAFSILNSTSHLMVPSDKWADIDNNFYGRVTELKKYKLKVLLSIGGWTNSGGTHWSKLIGNAEKRYKFIEHAVNFLVKHNFDGIDLDYEYPGCPQNNISAAQPNDISNFIEFVSELNTACKKLSLMVTFTSAGGEKIVKKCNNISAIWKHVDLLSVMEYDFYSYADGQTGPNAPLCGTGTSWGVFESIKYYLEVAKCPPEKLIMGIPFYAKSYTLANRSKPQFGEPVSGAGLAGPYTASSGTLAYYEVCLNQKNGWKSGFNKINGSYAWNDTQFVSFDGKIDIVRKSCLIRDYFKMKGAMVWDLSFDDFNNICGHGSYPLLKTLNYYLRCVDSSKVNNTCS